MKRYQMLIGGEWVDAEARETFETENPYLGAAWAFVPRAKGADVDRAVEAARKAFRAPSWAKISATARGALLRKLADLIAAEADRLAEIETRDNGKLITEMRTQLRYIPQWFNYFGGPRGQDRGPGHPDRQARHDQLHPRRAARGRGGDHAVEFAADARRPGSSRRRSRPATRSSGSRPNSRRCRRSSSDACSRRRAFLRAS